MARQFLGLKNLVVEKKRPVFLTNLFLSEQMKLKNHNRVYKKKHFLDFLGEKLTLDYVINAKSQILHAKFFFAKIYI